MENVIPNYKPSIMHRMKSSSASSKKKYSSICYKYQTVNGMVYLYDYFMKNRLYCDMKFYRVSKIKRFIEIRKYNKAPKDSIEYKIYASFLLDWIQYENPLWHKVPFVQKIR